MTLDDLLRLGDEDFVLQAYRAVLGREPDESGRANYLEQVRMGADKPALLVALATSREGRERGAPVEGLAELVARHQAPRPHRLRRAISRLMQPFRPEPLEPVLRQQRVLENRLYRIEALLQQQAAGLQALEARLARVAAGEPRPQALVEGTAEPLLPRRLVPPAAHRHHRSLVAAFTRRHGPGS